MKLSNEAKVGALAIVAILILVLGFNFLKGRSLFKKQPTLYAVFQNLGSLEKSNAVKINGLTVGSVYDFAPTDKEVNNVIVEIRLNRDIAIPRNSIAFIDGSLVGAAFINIEKGDANKYLKDGDTVVTRLDLGMLASLKTQVTPTLTRVNETLDSLKLAIGSINQIFDPNTNNNLQTMIARLAITSAHLERLLNSQSGALAQSLDNLNSVSGNLAKNNDAISSSIRNVEVTTSNLANARIQETVAAMEGTIGELKTAAAGLKSSIDRINSREGTIGALVNERKLYDQLNRAVLGLEILFDDIRVHPKRYVNLSLFGGGGKGQPLTSPLLKDTVPVRQ